MISRDEAEQVLADRGRVYAGSGHDLGPVARVFLDSYTGWPSFVTVVWDRRTGEEAFVALHEAKLRGRDVVVPYTLRRVENAPRVPAGGALSPGEEDDLFDYYEVPLEGVEPSVAHLGSALTPRGGQVVETDPEPHP